MDEPCSALDPRSTKKIEELIATLREQYTIVIVTHNMQQAARISDCAAFFYEGKLIGIQQDRHYVHRPSQFVPQRTISQDGLVDLKVRLVFLL